MKKYNADAETDYFIGLDVGGTKCSVVLGDGEFNLYGKYFFETRTERGPRLIIEDLKLGINQLLKECPGAKIRRIGISCGGPLDSGKGMIYSPPNLPGWDAIPLTDIFSDEYGVEACLQNDANACALAEWLMGAGKGTKNMIFLTFGTGLGAGLILDGRLYSGTNDLAGEVGHIRLEEDGPVGFGKAGSFEGFCSGGGIARLARMVIESEKRKGNEARFPEGADTEISAKTVALAAGRGDEVARKIMHISAVELGRGLAFLVDILNPECIVIGSIYARNESFFKPVIDELLQQEAIPDALKVCTVRKAMLGDTIGDYAALCVAVYQDRFKS